MKETKSAQIEEIIKIITNHKNDYGMVYCQTIKQCEAIAKELKVRECG